MFSFNGLVLKKIQVKDSKCIVSVFSREYWKISVWLKESRWKSIVDIWNIYNFSLKTESWINKAEWVKAKIIINTERLDYDWIANILKICATLEKILPNWVQFEKIFDDYFGISPLFEDIEFNNKVISFFTLRLLKKLWVAKNPENDQEFSINFKKIFSIIDTYWIDRIIKIEWITEDLIQEIQIFNEYTLIHYIN
jgi:recombinational DNA repair protein (RecF pathway)